MSRRVLAASLVLVSMQTSRAQVIFEATAAGPEANAQAGIQATVDAFRAALGDPNNGNAVGSQGSGRRQITWDGADNDAAPARLPADFFNAIAPRGAIFGGDSRISFQVSADATPAVPGTLDEFGNINATYPTAFSVFSSPRLFSAQNNNVLEVQFVIPGTLDPAVVSGFGSVFTDVDLPSTSMIEYFDASGTQLFTHHVLASAGNEGLSFLGVLFDAPVVRRVRITSGTQALGPNDVTQTPSNPDIVVMDDFIYGEPLAIPDNDGDGVIDPLDGCPDDAAKTNSGVCGCGLVDLDSDSDGTPDCFDLCAMDPNKIAPGICGCDTPDTDANGNQVPDCLESAPQMPNNVCGLCAAGATMSMSLILGIVFAVKTVRGRYRRRAMMMTDDN
ncbi:MAG TPA: hypothetical protein VJZ71_12170 [Phycisphaerae bacterium]|nr:hypothetical protein [Phycisphaerae bacterium]